MRYFLSFGDIAGGGISGGSASGGHPNWFELDDLSLLTSTDALGRPVFSGADLRLLDDYGLVGLLTHLTDQTAFAGATLHAVADTGGAPVLDLDLGRVLLTALTQAADGTERLSVSFEAIVINSFTPDRSGALVPDPGFGWDLAANRTTTVPDSASPASGPALRATAQWFLLIDGMDGGSQNATHQGWFEVADFDLAAAAGGFGPLDLTVLGQPALTALLAHIAQGQGLTGLRLEAVDDFGAQAQRIDLVGVTIDALSLGHATTDLRFGYDAIKIQRFAPDGSLAQSVERDQAGGTAVTVPVLTPDTQPTGPATADTYFLAIQGLRGEATDPGHVGWFRLADLGWDISTANGRAEFSLLDVTFATSAALGQLVAAVAAGAVLGTVSIQGVNHAAPSQVAFELTLGNASFSALSETANATLAAKLGFTSFEATTAQIDATGDVVARQAFGWDLAGNLTTHVATASPGVGALGVGGATEFFVLIDGLYGDSTTLGHEGWFHLDDFGLDIAHLQQLTAASASGAVTFGLLDLVFAGATGLSDLLQKASLTQRITGLRIEGLTQSGDLGYRLDVAGCKLVSVDQTLTQGGAGAAVSVSYDQIGVTLFDGLGGSRSSGWNLLLGTNAPVLPTVQPGAAHLAGITPDAVFLALSGLGGTATDAPHQGWFEVLSADYGMGISGGKPVYDSLTVTLADFGALPALMTAFATGRALSGATLQGMSSTRITAQVDLSQVVVRDMAWQSTPGGQRLVLTLGFAALEHTGFAYDASGALGGVSSFGWNTVTNTQTTVASATPGALTLGDALPDFMLIDGLNGALMTNDHGGWFAVARMEMGLKASAAAPFGQVAVTVSGEVALTALLTRLTAGASVAGVTFDGVDATGALRTQTALGSVHVVSVLKTGAGYVVTLDYDKITVKSFDLTGAVVGSFGWDTVTDTAFGGEITTNPGGTARDDGLTGTRLDNLLAGAGGDDSLFGIAGNDTLRGEAGRDLLDGGTGRDTADFSDKTLGVAVTLNGATNATATVGAWPKTSCATSRT